MTLMLLLLFMHSISFELMLFSLAVSLLQCLSLVVLASLRLMPAFLLAASLFLNYAGPFSSGFAIRGRLATEIASDEYRLGFEYAFLAWLLLAQDCFSLQVHAVKIH